MKELQIKSPRESFLDAMELAIKESFPKNWDDDMSMKALMRLSDSKIKTGAFTAIPMICQNHKCPFKNSCEFYKEKKAPEGSPCPYELGMVRSFMASYIEQLEIDTDNWVEVGQIRDLVNQDIQMTRAAKYLAKEDFIQENVIGVDSDGDPVFKKELHQAVELEDKIHRRKAQMLKQILATRESRIKAGAASIDSAQNMAALVEKMRKIEKEQSIELKRQLNIIDVDEYVQEDEDQE